MNKIIVDRNIFTMDEMEALHFEEFKKIGYWAKFRCMRLGRQIPLFYGKHDEKEYHIFYLGYCKIHQVYYVWKQVKQSSWSVPSSLPNNVDPEHFLEKRIISLDCSTWKEHYTYLKENKRK